MASRLLRALTDPWTGLTAAIGGVAWAATLGFPLAAGAAALAYSVKVAYDTAFPREAAPVRPEVEQRLPEPPNGSLEAALVTRARQAVHTLGEIADTTADQWSREQIASVRTEASQVVPDLLRAAQRLTTATAARGRIDVGELERYRADLARRRSGTPEDLQRSRASVQAQLDIAARLDETCSTLASQLESAVLDLETLTAQAAELSAVTITTVDTARPVEELITKLAGVREGLRAADDYSREALEQ